MMKNSNFILTFILISLIPLFGGQGTFILRDGDSITFMADIWNPESLPDSRHLWLPFTFDKNGTPIINAPEAYIKAEAGR